MDGVSSTGLNTALSVLTSLIRQVGVQVRYEEPHGLVGHLTFSGRRITTIFITELINQLLMAIFNINQDTAEQ
ncbi:Hypothetical predicted protein [Xyrichtys novacula]|uniref:Uncharacterized protein n=1 Tax=Xyrichtys novacula TaxID=13765 RepID=A0AAV1FME4_XYRNO|nr:Hypothetical predicted protein [Xyrichtys novacula]